MNLITNASEALGQDGRCDRGKHEAGTHRAAIRRNEANWRRGNTYG